jgi:hypothetical protein
VSFRAGSATFYDLPSPKPPIRTVMCRADTVLRMSRLYTLLEREAIHVRHRLGQAADIRLGVRGDLEVLVDLSVQVRGGWQIAGDARVVVVRIRAERRDTAQRVGQRLDVRGDLELTLFHVLLNETHLIAI